MTRSSTVTRWLAGAAVIGTFLGVASCEVARPQRVVPSLSLCQADEHVLFRCAIGRQFASVCASRSGKKPVIEYRFGQPGDVEFVHSSSVGELTWARTGYSGGGELQTNFENGVDRYVLYSRVVRTGFGPEGNYPTSETGIAVIRSDKILSDRRCNDPEEDGFVGDVDTLLPEGEFTWWEPQE